MLRRAHFLSANHIESTASGVLRRYFGRVPPPFLPVPLEAIVEEDLKFLISWESLEDDAMGLTLGGVRPTWRQIVLNDRALSHFEKYTGSENFTKAHEIGHIVLHVQPKLAEAPLFDLPSGPPAIVCTSAAIKPQREVQADIFASVLLMPEDLMRAMCRGRDLRNWAQFYSLRDEVGVSITALRIRLKQIGIPVVAVDGEG